MDKNDRDKLRSICGEDVGRILDKWRPHIRDVMALGMLGTSRSIEISLFDEARINELFTDATALMCSMIGQEQADKGSIPEGLDCGDEHLDEYDNVVRCVTCDREIGLCIC